MNQHTLRSRISLSGRGLHTGQQVTASLCPAPIGNGITFRRTDLIPNVDIPALASQVCSTARGTTISKGQAHVSTIEHLMSALHALGIDNAIIEVTGEEVPILSGNALPWVNAIHQAGIDEQQAPRQYKTVREPFHFQIDAAEFSVKPADHFSADCIIDFHTSVLGRQEYAIENLDNYETDIAPCRTFVFLNEIHTLLLLGLIKGGSLDNALVYADRPLTSLTAHRLARHYGCDVDQLKVNNGVINTTQPLFPDEPARHKLLDFIGDIMLVGGPILGDFTIKYPGHKANTAFAKALMKIL